MARLFECTEQTIRNAARGVTSGEEAERIRVEAVKQGFAIKEKPISMEEYNRYYKEN
ncbi:hypothetical protein [Bacteroides faecis]|uniref:hypothetical protein n=1 Tax=Bacteroides faecis TaxID=674529 RepID=UPI003DA2D28B